MQKRFYLSDRNCSIPERSDPVVVEYEFAVPDQQLNEQTVLKYNNYIGNYLKNIILTNP
jgi:hypothetical protein